MVKAKSLSQLHYEKKPLLAKYRELSSFDMEHMRTVLELLGFDEEKSYVKMTMSKSKRRTAYDIGYTDPHYQHLYGSSSYIPKKDGGYFVKHHFLTDQEIRRHFTAYARSHKDDSEKNVKRVVESVIAMSSRKSNTIVLDIDNHGSQNYAPHARAITKWIVNMFAPQVLFYEQNTTTGSSHIYLWVKENWTDDQLKSFCKQLTSDYDGELEALDIKIDMRYSNKRFRIPGSYNYVLHRRDHGIIPTTTMFINHLRRFWTLQAQNSHTVVEQYVCQGAAWQKATQEAETVVEKAPPEVYFPVVGRERAAPKKTFNITAGNRVGGTKEHWRLAFYCIEQKMSADQFYELSLQHNAGSQDLSSSKARDLCDKLYERAQKYFKPRSNASRRSSDFKSNYKLLHRLHKSHCRKVARMLVRTEKRGYWRCQKFKTYLALLWQTTGWMLYDASNPRAVLSDNKLLTPHERANITKGAVFSTQFLDQLKKHYRLQTNIGHYFNLLIRHTPFLRQFKFTGRGYSFEQGKRYCRQWVLGDSTDHTTISLAQLANQLLLNLKRCIRTINLHTHRARSLSFQEHVLPSLDRIVRLVMSDMIEAESS